jgi:hypothetical protein
MTQTQHRVLPPPPADRLHIDLSAVAGEPPAESIAHENEIVEHIAHEDDFPERPAPHSVEEQLCGLIDPVVIRSHP